MAAAPPKETAFPALAPRVPSEFRASLLQIPIFGDEKLVVAAFNIHPTLTATVQVQGRLWSDAGRDVQYFTQSIDVAAGGVTVANIILERGALLTVRVLCQTTNIVLGDVFAALALVKGVTVPTTGAGHLLQGYVGPQNVLAWPGSPIQTSLQGPGVVRIQAWTAVTTALLRVTVPASRRWRVITAFANVGTDANVGLRTILLSVRSGVNVIFSSQSAPGQPASTGVGYTLAPGTSPTAAALQALNLIPFLGDLELRGGDILEWEINAAFAGDLIVSQGVQVREWFDP